MILSRVPPPATSATLRRAAIWLAFGLGGLSPSWLVGQQAMPVPFEQEIRPLLQQRCGACHGAKEQQGGLRLDARHAALRGGDGGPVIMPGKPDASELIRRIASDDPDERMPPEQEPLPAVEIDRLRRWIEQGAVWPETEYDRQAARDPRREHWSFQPWKAVSPPAVSPSQQAPSEPANPIDAFLLHELAKRELSFSPPAVRRTLIRRLYLDLLGLPPAPAEIQAFVEDPRPGAYERLVDRLLASPRYGERWAQHWLDVVRYADTHGFEVNTPREHAWPYRDYVIRSFNEDKPYRRFVREQLAGDVLGADAATGFLVASAVLLPGQIGADDASKRLARQDELDEIIQGVSATMLGLTVGCARCHDHKFDPITARDYYAMQAFFAGVRYGDRPLQDEAYRRRLQLAKGLQRRIEQRQAMLAEYESQAHSSETWIIDEQDPERTQVFKKANGPGVNPPGVQRGYRDDPGDPRRLENLSGGQYTWWDNRPGEDVLAYTPQVEGAYRLWISWGVHGSGVHTRDARYVLDRDGDLTTRDDQQLLAKVDQYYPAGVHEGVTESKPLWSGLLDLGVVPWTAASKLLVRGGETGAGITADVIVLQEVDDVKEVAKSNGSSGRLPEALTPRLRAPLNAQRNVERFRPTLARFIRFLTLETSDDNRHEPCIDELEVYGADDPATNLALASQGAKAASSGDYADIGPHQLRHVNDGQYGNERSWISSERGGGWVQIELPAAARIERVVWGRDRSGKFSDRLAVRYRIETSRDGRLWRRVASHHDRVPRGAPHDPIIALARNLPPDAPSNLPELASELDAWRKQQQELRQPPLVYAGVFGEPDVTQVLRRGDPEQPLEAIDPAIPELFVAANADRAANPGGASEEQRRRLRLANWIASPDNPLTARVIVNRLWRHHFGQGLVATPSDFGVNGAPPSHPELLDWLAAQLVEQQWSLKRIQQLIVCSAAYRQTQRPNERAGALDQDNRLLWTFAGRRLEAEAIRDTILAVSGELNLNTGGPGFNFFQSRGGLNGFPAVREFGADGLRRMIYAHRVRMERAPVFGAFDCPDGGQATPDRGQSITAIQALNLFNSAFVIRRSEEFAARLQRRCGAAEANQADCIREAFQITLGRPPSAREEEAASATVNDHGLATLCRALLNSNEFLFIP